MLMIRARLLIPHARSHRRPAQQPRLTPPLPHRNRRLVPPGDALQRERKLYSGVRGGLGVHGDGIPMDVVDVVASLVVAHVVRRAGAGEEA